MKNKMRKVTSLLLVALLLISSAVFSAGALESAGAGATIEQVTGNVLTNGSFDNSVDGWTAEGGTAEVSRTITETYEDGAAAAYVEQAASAKLYQTVSIRKYSWYKYSVAVKLAAGTEDKEAALVVDYIPDSVDVAATEEQAAVTVNDDDWTVVSGYFMRQNTGTELEHPVANDADYYYQSANIYLNVGEGEAVNYYMDDFCLTRLEGFVNSDFSEGTFGWDQFKSAKSNITIEEEEQGKKKAVVSHTTNSEILMGQPMSFDKGVTYEITAKLKITPAEGEDAQNYIRIRSYPNRYNISATSAAPYVNSAIPVVNNEWQSIKSTFTYTGEDPVYNTYLTLYFNPASKKVTYEFMDFEVKKQTNLITNPYFSTIAFNGVSSSGAVNNKDLTGWASYKYMDVDLFDVSNNSANTFDTIGTYDNSFSRGNIDVYDKTNVDAGKAQSWWNNSLYQRDIVLEEGRKYNLSIALNRADTTSTKNTDAGVKFIMQHSYPKADGTGTATQNVNNISQDYITIPTGWDTYEATYQANNLPDGYESTLIALRNDCEATESELMYYDDFTVEPVYEAPVVTAVDAGAIVAQAALPAATVTVADSPDAISYRYRYLLYDSASDTSGTPVLAGHTTVGGSIPAATAANAWGGKYVSLEVTPLSEYGMWGESVESTKVLVSSAYDITPSISGEITAGQTVSANVSVTNNLTEDLPVMVIIAYFLPDGQLCKTAVGEATVVNGTPATLNPSITLPGDAAGGWVKVFTWKGYDGAKISMQPLVAAVQKP